MKKINKRACRAYANHELKIHPGNGLLIAEQFAYLVCTTVKVIAGQRLLLLYIYSREQAAAGQATPLWTIFQSKNEFYNLIRKEDGSAVWRGAPFVQLDSSYYFANKCAFYSPKDRERLERYCKGEPGTGFRSLESLQRKIKEQQLRLKRVKKEKATLQRMTSVPALPRGLKGWIHRELMPTYLFYDYQRKKGPQKAYCTTCNKDVTITGAKHNAEGICPGCKKKAVFKSRRKRGHIEDRLTCQVIQQLNPDELILRIVKVYYCFYHKDEPKEYIYENARCFIQAREYDQESADCRSEYYYTSYSSGILTPWRPGLRPVFNHWCYNFNADLCGYLYTKNLDDALRDTKWQYCQLKTYYLRDMVPLMADTYLHTYIKHPLLEYLVKLRLQRLADYLVFNFHPQQTTINVGGKNLCEILGIEAAHFPFIQSLNPDGRQLNFVKATIQAVGTLDKELLQWCDRHEIRDSDKIQLPLSLTTSHRLMHYGEEQLLSHQGKKGAYENMALLLSSYWDYLRMCQQLEYDLNNDFVLFPRHLKKSHDKLSELIDEEKAAIYDSEIKSQYPHLQEQYSFAADGFMVVPPHTAREIVQEGHKLRHCVGSYAGRVADKKCTILFIRSEKKPEKPLCTVELKDNEIKQAYCFKNSQPPEEIAAFLSLWEKQVLKTTKPLRLAA